jgi:hypothetical protein
MAGVFPASDPLEEDRLTSRTGSEIRSLASAYLGFAALLTRTRLTPTQPG